MRPTSAGAGEQHHICCKRGDLAKYPLVIGDPDRVPKIAKFWDESHDVVCHREFRSFSGKYRGVSISAMSSGFGLTTVAISVNEAVKILDNGPDEAEEKE